MTVRTWEGNRCVQNFIYTLRLQLAGEVSAFEALAVRRFPETDVHGGLSLRGQSHSIRVVAVAQRHRALPQEALTAAVALLQRESDLRYEYRGTGTHSDACVTVTQGRNVMVLSMIRWMATTFQ